MRKNDKKLISNIKEAAVALVKFRKAMDKKTLYKEEEVYNARQNLSQLNGIITTLITLYASLTGEYIDFKGNDFEKGYRFRIGLGLRSSPPEVVKELSQLCESNGDGTYRVIEDNT